MPIITVSGQILLKKRCSVQTTPGVETANPALLSYRAWDTTDALFVEKGKCLM